MPLTVPYRTQLADQLHDALNELHDLAQRVRGRPMSDDERSAVRAAIDKAAARRDALEAALSDDDLSSEIRGLFNGINPPHTSGRSDAHGLAQSAPPGLRWADGKTWGEHMVKQNSPDGVRFKALAPVGTIVTPLPAPMVIPMGAPVMHLRQLIPTEPATPAYSFLQQTVRTDAAAPVLPGAAKPVSDFQTQLVPGRAQVVATLSNPVDRFLLQDAPNLANFLNSEMTYAVETAIENSLLNGLATDPIVGFLNTSGVLLQAFATDMLMTLANAISLIERTGIPATGIVMNYTDWLNLTLIKDTIGHYMVGAEAPVETAAQRVWGRPVVLSVKMPASKALVGDFTGSAKLFVVDDGHVITQWSEAAPVAQGPPVLTAFQTNQVVFRSETRINLGVLRPAGFCVTTLA
jgi:HK97 family phage major capsid protein